MRRIYARTTTLLLISLVVLIIAGGCASVGPDYVRPDTKVSEKWHTQLEGALMSDDSAPETLASWWSTLDDPYLSNLIERAVKGNLDLKKAQARVREARAQRGVAMAGLFPTLDASGAATRNKSADNFSSNGSDDFRNNWTDLYNSGFDASWEIDIFGGVRRSVEAAQRDLEASREGLRDTLVSLVAETAQNYVDVRSYQRRIAVAESNFKAQKSTYDLVAWRHQAGLTDELAVQEARYNLENTRSQIPALKTGLEKAMNRIAVLLGEQPGAIHAYLELPLPIPSTSFEVAVGIPADVLRRRPDVRQAERQLAAQTARVGVATADLYPKLTLNGSIGLESLNSNNLFTSGSSSWSFGPRITWAIFRGGAIRQKIEVQSALQEQALAHYERTVLGALEDVENALTAYSEELKRREALKAAEEAARSAVEMAEHKYEAGLINFIVVLDAQRSLLSFQEQLAQSEGAIVANLVKLYKALGGGWQRTAAGEDTVTEKGKKDGIKN